MPADTQKIENLMKVSLSINIAKSEPAAAADVPFVFIYGVGPDGITPFEKALFGKVAGDRIDFSDIAGNFSEALGHLKSALCEQTGIASANSLQVTVTGVVKAPDREVVKAMATGGGCSDCGCGCGGH
jgi:hypothetical protein